MKLYYHIDQLVELDNYNIDSVGWGSPFLLVPEATTVDSNSIEKGDTLTIITYGMGVYWATDAAKKHKGKVEIIDLRTINPIDEELVFERVNKHGKCLVLTEEPYNNSFAQALSGRIQENCFKNLDAPIYVMGSENLPAIPLNSTLEATMLPNAEKVSEKIEKILAY